MSQQPIEIPLDLSGNYTDQVQQATAATEGLQTAVAGVTLASGGVARALDAASPSRRHIAAWSGFTAAAAYWQTQTADIRAGAKSTGQDLNSLEGDVRSLARSFPIGTNGAVQMVRTVQSLGVTTRATQPNVRALAKDLIDLEAANSSMGSGLGESFGQLNRQMASLDPARLSRFSDVLTTISQRTGGSALGIVSFSRSIAPMAQQAGVGETAVLGISSAFVKLGDDGGAAATAVNKIMGDLNRSVREGSNDMAAYAQITGMTVRQFHALYQANPAQALAQVTTAIGQAGPGRGQQILESLGLEGVRTQRALLQLSQSGGLQQAINQAQQAYGNGNTRNSAQAALGGLNNQLDMLTSAAGQAGDALGGPLLKPLTFIAHLATTVLGPISGVLNSGVGQGVLSAGIYGALGLRLAGRATMPLSLAALGTQAATSGPVRGLLGGFAFGRRGMDLSATEGSRLGRFGGDALDAYTQGAAYGRGPMVGVNRFATSFGTQVGLGYGRLMPDNPGGGLGFGSVGRNAFVGGSLGFEAWMRSFRDPFHQAFTPAGQRTSLLMPGRDYDPATGRALTGAARQGAMANFLDTRQAEGTQVAFRNLQAELGGTRSAVGRLAISSLAAARDVTTFGVRASVAAGGGLARGIAGSALGMVGGVGGALTLGAIGAYSLYRRGQADTASQQAHVANLDIYGTLNQYRDAIGQAGVATVTLADQVQNAATRIMNSVTTVPQATSVSSGDLQVALGKDRGKITHTYAGNNTQIANQIRALNIGGLTPQDLQQVKIDLLRQNVTPDRVQAILGMASQGGTPNISSIISSIGSGNSALTGSSNVGFWRAFGRGADSPGGNYWNTVGRNHFYDLGMQNPHVSGVQQQQVDLVQGAIGQQFLNASDRGGAAYGAQRALASANKAMAAAVKTHDADLVVTLERGLTQQLTGKAVTGMTAQDIQSAGSLTNLLRQRGLTVYGQDLGSIANAQMTRQTPADVTLLQSAGLGPLASLFNPGGGGANRTVDRYLTSGADSPRALTKAMIASTNALTNTGQSLSDIAHMAVRGMGTVGENTPEAALFQAMLGRTQFQQQSNLIGATRAETFAGNAQMGFALANTMGNSQSAQQARSQGEQQLQSSYQGMVQYYQQRLMAQYQFQIQSTRAQQDYQRQVGREEQDFYISRQRAMQDFNIQIRREREDAATSLYNPYERIQAKPVYDAGNLMLNMQEQLQAMRQQVRNIHRLRALGLTEQALRILGAYDPANAQQVQQLVSDLQSDHGMVGQFNSDAAQRERVAGQLLSESPQFRRQQEDFHRQLNRQQDDFNRMRERQQQDFSISMQRMAQDLQMQDMEITNNLETLQKDMQRILKGQTVDFTSAVHDNLARTLQMVGYYAPRIKNKLHIGSGGTSGGDPGAGSGITASGGVSGGGFGNAAVGGSNSSDNTMAPGTHATTSSGTVGTSYVNPGTGKVYTGSLYDEEVPSAAFQHQHPADRSFNKSIARAMRPDWARKYWKDWDALWTAESGWSQYAHNDSDPNNYGSGAYGIPQAYPGRKMSDFGRDWTTNPATQIAWGIHYIATRYGDPHQVAMRKNLYGNYKGYQLGGIATRPHLGMVAESGSAEAMIPLDRRGAQFFAAAVQKYLTPHEASSMRYATYIDQSIHYHDSGVHIEHADVAVEADDPVTLGRRIGEHTRKENLTAARGVAWQRSS